MHALGCDSDEMPLALSAEKAYSGQGNGVGVQKIQVNYLIYIASIGEKLQVLSRNSETFGLKP
jgi:hypothetical protein